MLYVVEWMFCSLTHLSKKSKSTSCRHDCGTERDVGFSLQSLRGVLMTLKDEICIKDKPAGICQSFKTCCRSTLQACIMHGPWCNSRASLSDTTSSIWNTFFQDNHSERLPAALLRVRQSLKMQLIPTYFCQRCTANWFQGAAPAAPGQRGFLCGPQPVEKLMLI